jgi:hypothetical protein
MRWLAGAIGLFLTIVGVRMLSLVPGTNDDEAIAHVNTIHDPTELTHATLRARAAQSTTTASSASVVPITNSNPSRFSPEALEMNSTRRLDRTDGDWGALLSKVALVVIGGRNRTKNLQAAFDTWTTVFTQRLFLTDADPTESNVSGALASHMVNVYSQYKSEWEALASVAHPDHPIFHPELRTINHDQNSHQSAVGREMWASAHGIGWHLSQPKYLLGLQELKKRFPQAQWYGLCDFVHSVCIARNRPSFEVFSREQVNCRGPADVLNPLASYHFEVHRSCGVVWCGVYVYCFLAPHLRYVVADSDTLLFPRRLLVTTRLLTLPANEPLYMGSIQTTSLNDRKLKFPLGGAGIVISKGAVDAMDIDECVRLQKADLGWSTYPADWRVGLCLDRANVPHLDPLYVIMPSSHVKDHAQIPLP